MNKQGKLNKRENEEYLKWEKELLARECIEGKECYLLSGVDESGEDVCNVCNDLLLEKP